MTRHNDISQHQTGTCDRKARMASSRRTAAAASLWALACAAASSSALSALWRSCRAFRASRACARFASCGQRVDLKPLPQDYDAARPFHGCSAVPEQNAAFGSDGLCLPLRGRRRRALLLRHSKDLRLCRALCLELGLRSTHSQELRGAQATWLAPTTRLRQRLRQGFHDELSLIHI